MLGRVEMYALFKNEVEMQTCIVDIRSILEVG